MSGGIQERWNAFLSGKQYQKKEKDVNPSVV